MQTQHFEVQRDNKIRREQCGQFYKQYNNDGGSQINLNGIAYVGAATDINKTGVGYGVFAQLATLTARFATPAFTTFTAGGYYTGAPTTFVDTINRFPIGVFVETYGGTSKVTLRGCCQLQTGLTSLPIGA